MRTMSHGWSERFREWTAFGATQGGLTASWFAVPVLSWVVLASGCMVGPDYRPPQTEVPARWHQEAAEGLAKGEADVQTWWRSFDDELLTRLIHQAGENNLDVRLAVLRIREARALRGIAAGELLPSLAGQGAWQRARASANGLMSGSPQVPGKGEQFANTVTRGIATSALAQKLGTAVPGAPGVTNSVASGLVGLLPGQTELGDTEAMDLYAAGFDASWEIDVFGGIRRNIESADAVLAAAVEDYRSVLVSLLAEVAATYIDVRALQSQIEATQRNIKLQKETVSLTQVKFDSELVSELDVRQAETNLATTESELPLFEAGLSVAIYRLGVLIGREPAALYDELSVVGDIPKPPAETLIGVPVDLVRRRPDVRAAECRLAAQTAQIGVAAADLYPRFSLSGTFGFEATDINHMLDARSVTYGFGPALRWNIFDGLRNINHIAAQQAATHQAYVSYEKTLLLALQDVETALVAYTREQARYAALVRATEAGRRSAQLAETRYQDGLTDFQNVLIAQRALVNLETALAQSRGQVAVNLVALYKALGGGWSPHVVPQEEYLDDPSGVLADPLNFFLSGGQGTLPWETGVDEIAETTATLPGTE